MTIGFDQKIFELCETLHVGYVCGGKMYKDIPGFRPDTIIVTNIGQGQAIDGMLKKAGALDYLTTNGLIACYHERGSDVLANRALKDFGHEQLPFKRFGPNAAWYYMMLVGHFLPESFLPEISLCCPDVAFSVVKYSCEVRI